MGIYDCLYGCFLNGIKMGYVVIKDENLLELLSIRWAKKQLGGDEYG